MSLNRKTPKGKGSKADSNVKLTPRSAGSNKNEIDSRIDQEFSPKGKHKRLVPSVEGEVYLDKRRSEKISLDASGLKNLSTLSEGAYVMSERLKNAIKSSTSEIKPPISITVSKGSNNKKGKRKASIEKKRILYSETNLAKAIITYLNKECKGGETQKRFGVPRQTVVMHCTKMHLKQKKKRTAAEREALERDVNKYLEKLNRPGRPSKVRKSVEKTIEYLSYSENSLKYAITAYLNKECKGADTQRLFGVPRQTVVMHCTKMGLTQEKNRSASEKKKMQERIDNYIQKRSRSSDP